MGDVFLYKWLMNKPSFINSQEGRIGGPMRGRNEKREGGHREAPWSHIAEEGIIGLDPSLVRSCGNT